MRRKTTNFDQILSMNDKICNSFSKVSIKLLNTLNKGICCVFFNLFDLLNVIGGVYKSYIAIGDQIGHKLVKKILLGSWACQGHSRTSGWVHDVISLFRPFSALIRLVTAEIPWLLPESLASSSFSRFSKLPKHSIFAPFSAQHVKAGMC